MPEQIAYLFTAKEIVKHPEFQKVLTERRLKYFAEKKGLPYSQPGGKRSMRIFDIRKIREYLASGQPPSSEKSLRRTAKMIAVLLKAVKD